MPIRPDAASPRAMVSPRATAPPQAMAAPRAMASPRAVLAGGAAFLLTVTFSPVVAAPFWTPRAALLLILGAVGLPVLVRLWWSPRSRRAALAAGAFLAVAVVATAASPDPLLALLGAYGWGTGLLFVAAIVAAWALGRSLEPGDRVLVERALLAGVAVNAAVAVLQTVADLGVAELRPFEGRAGALVGNPVQLGALMAAGLALLAPRVGAAGRPWAWLAAFAGVAAALELSGSRFALGVAVAVVVVHGIRLGARRGVALALALAVGIGAATAATGLATEDTAASTERALATPEGAAGGITPRLETWAGGWQALADRPLLGAGPGRFRAATSKYRTLDLVRAEAPDKLFVDAHNLGVEYAVTTGVLGVTALAAWIVLALKGAGGPLLGAALALFALHLVQPQGADVTPLAFLALGASVAAGPVPVGWPARAGAGALAAVAAAAGGVLFVGDFRLDQAVLDFHRADARAADSLLPAWPEPADMRARIRAFEWVATDDVRHLEDARDWSERAARRDPTDPLRWNRLGELELRLGRSADALGRFRTALRHDPWSVRALLGYARASMAEGRPEDAAHALDRALLVGPNEAAEDLLASLDHIER